MKRECLFLIAVSRMYRSSNTPAEKVVFPAQPSPDDVETTASDIQLHA